MSKKHLSKRQRWYLVALFSTCAIVNASLTLYIRDEIGALTGVCALACIILALFITICIGEKL